ncbi:hypothetical protein ACTS93_14005 [Empedobacter falsenii]
MSDINCNYRVPSDLLNKYISLQVNYYIGHGEIDKINLLVDKIPSNKLDLYIVRIGFNYEEKIDLSILKTLTERLNLNILFKQELLLYWFEFCRKNNRIGELIELLVNSYFENPHLLKILNINNLISDIIDKDYDLEKIEIDLPIFFYIANSEDYFQFAALDVYLNSIGLTKPSELDIFEDSFKEKKIYLLEKISNLNVLNNFYLVFENDEDVLQERIEILRRLISLNDLKSNKYFEEIAVLLRKIKVDSTIQNYNNGKISLNFERIKEENIQSLETSFNRFIKLRDYSNKNELKIIESDQLINNLLDEFVKRDENFQDASFVAFKAIFLEMVNVFLFSKEHGLDGDLSTRIRHGVLENKLRSVFINNNIISTKNNDKYIEIDYWKEMCNSQNYLDEISISIQIALKTFSSEIDDLIFNIKDEYIQIISYKHFSKEKALFNYTFTEEYLWLIYKTIEEEVSTYSDFQEICFDILKDRTDSLLVNISEVFENQFVIKFINLLDKFESEIESIKNIGGEVYLELKQKIKFAKTQIENEVLEVSKWFKLTSFFDKYTLDIETIVLTAIEIINNDLDVKINPNIKFPSKNYLIDNGYSYIEIFKILIENSIKHSKINIAKLDIEIKINDYFYKNTEDGEMIVLSFSISNNINTEVAELCNMDYISDNWNSTLINVNIEGGSGYQKINRILKHGNKVNSDIDFEVNEKFKVNFSIYSKSKIV